MPEMRSLVSKGLMLCVALAFATIDASVSFAADPVPAKQLFGRRDVPADMRARSIGSYAKGCLAGGAALPVDGPYWQAMRLSRNRNWGHPVLVSYLEKLAETVATKDGWNGLMVGDLAQPRGGPMLTGHASHQIGLDADIWLRPMPDRVLSRKEREEISAISVLKKNTLYVDDNVWTDAHLRVLKRAASYDEVARIFVHPGIKKKLCETAGNDRAFLRKIRPWYGHHYHFHVRLNCPTGSKGCKNQATPPAGDSCGAPLDFWFKKMSEKPPKPTKPSTKPAKPVKPRYTKLSDLPQACGTVLDAPAPGGIAVRKLALTWPPHPWKNAPPPKARPIR